MKNKKAVVSLNNKTILVTGSPGFIGANLVLRLLKEMNAGTIISFDSMNDYYDPKLKEYRLGLIEEAGRLEAPGRPILFKTSMEFLRSFGLESLEDLPEIDPELLERFREEAEEMVPGERTVKA